MTKQQLNLERVKLKMTDLLFIDGVAIYHDALQESNRKFALVDKAGNFIFEKVNGFGERSFFLESIVIDENGLFLGKHQYGMYLFDKDGNHMRVDDFKVFNKILMNRDELPSIEDFYNPLEELLNSNFKICSTYGYWGEKSDANYINFGIDYNGLKYTVEYYRPVGKDYENEFEYVNDKKGNKMSLDDFWTCFLMIKNGQSYLREAREYLLLNSTEFN